MTRKHNGWCSFGVNCISIFRITAKVAKSAKGIARFLLGVFGVLGGFPPENHGVPDRLLSSQLVRTIQPSPGIPGGERGSALNPAGIVI